MYLSVAIESRGRVVCIQSRVLHAEQGQVVHVDFWLSTFNFVRYSFLKFEYGFFFRGECENRPTSAHFKLEPASPDDFDLKFKRNDRGTRNRGSRS